MAQAPGVRVIGDADRCWRNGNEKSDARTERTPGMRRILNEIPSGHLHQPKWGRSATSGEGVVRQEAQSAGTGRSVPSAWASPGEDQPTRASASSDPPSARSTEKPGAEMISASDDQGRGSWSLEAETSRRDPHPTCPERRLCGGWTHVKCMELRVLLAKCISWQKKPSANSKRNRMQCRSSWVRNAC